MMDVEPILVFVYNAESGFFEALKDGVMKIVSPASYPCRLCALTYDVAWMRPRWRRFVNNLGIEVEFLHKDEFKEKYKKEKPDLPCALIERDGELEVLINSDEMNAMETLDELMDTVEEGLDSLGLMNKK